MVRIGKRLVPRVGSRTHQPGPLILDDLGNENHLCLTTLEYKPTVHCFYTLRALFFFLRFHHAFLLHQQLSSSRSGLEVANVMKKSFTGEKMLHSVATLNFNVPHGQVYSEPSRS